MLPVIIAECSSPQEIWTTGSSRIQNLLAKLSANLVFPNVKTAPDSERSQNEKNILNWGYKKAKELSLIWVSLEEGL